MKIHFEPKDFLKTLKIVRGAPKTSPLYVEVCADSDSVTLCATDMKRGGTRTRRVEADVSESGSILLPVKEVIDALATIPKNSSATIEKTDEGIRLVDDSAGADWYFTDFVDTSIIPVALEAEMKSELEEQIAEDTTEHDEPEHDEQESDETDNEENYPAEIPDADEPESNDTDGEDDREETIPIPENLVATSKMLYIDAKGVKATGYTTENGFVVCDGSQAVMEPTESLRKYFPKVVSLRESLVEQDILKLDAENQVYVFTKNHVFDSIVNAANTILAVSSSKATWKNERGTQLKKTEKQKTKP